LFWVKNANFVAIFFGENIFKIVTSVPGLWLDVRNRSECLFYKPFLKMQFKCTRMPICPHMSTCMAAYSFVDPRIIDRQNVEIQMVDLKL
jgi:hypothetical protein